MSKPSNMLAGTSIKLDYKNPLHVKGATEFIMKMFPDSPAGKLGRFFLKHFYFTCLPKHGLIHCFLYQVGHTYPAAIIYTEYPFTFIKQGLKKSFFKLCWVTFIALLLKPSRIAVVLDLCKQDDWRRHAEDEQAYCEMLTGGVFPNYRKCIDGHTQKILTRLGIETAINEMIKAGKKHCLALVLRKNRLVKHFYAKYGTRRFPTKYFNPTQELLVFDLDKTHWTHPDDPA